jgi:hypothetical protein
MDSLRQAGRSLFRPTQLVKSVKLYHRQVYVYSIHRGKLAALLDPGSEHRRFRAMGEYLERMQTDCPHELFADDSGTARASSAKGSARFDLSQVQIVEKKNRATDTHENKTTKTRRLEGRTVARSGRGEHG